VSLWNKAGAEIRVWWEYRALRFFITLAITVALSLVSTDWPSLRGTAKQALFVPLLLETDGGYQKQLIVSPSRLADSLGRLAIRAW
jgi:hypothetical protein